MRIALRRCIVEYFGRMMYDVEAPLSSPYACFTFFAYFWSMYWLIWAIICGEKDNFLNSCSIASLCNNSLFDYFLNSSSESSQSKAILQEFKKLSFSPQTIAHINQHIPQKYAIKTKQEYQLLSGVSTSYIIPSK
jgi:hypothetical protein